MRYSIEPRYRIYVRGYGFLSSANIMGKHATEVAKNMSNKYSQKRLDSAKKSGVDAIKTPSKRAIQKTAEATGDLIGNKIADKVTKASKNNLEEEAKNEVEIPKERYIYIYIYAEKREQIIDELKLV